MKEDKDRLYNVYTSMKHRCNSDKNKSYKRYGGRGIKVCNEWESRFESFYKWAILNGYKKGLEIDRVDNNGNYEPNNCRWITKQDNIKRSLKGRKKSISELDNFTMSHTGKSADELSEIIEAITCGEFKARELSEHTGLDRHTLLRLANRYGYSTNYRKNHFTTIEISHIIKDRDTMKVCDIVKKYNSNKETIGSILKRRGNYA